MPHHPLALIPSSTGTTTLSQIPPSARPAWCLTDRKPLFLRPQAPRPQYKRRLQRGRRGASPPASPCFFVHRHHDPESKRSVAAAGVVPRHPLALVSSSTGTTTLSQNAPSPRPAWCLTARKPLFLRPEAPRPQILRPKRSSGWRSPTASSVPKSCGAPTALSPKGRRSPYSFLLLPPRTGQVPAEGLPQAQPAQFMEMKKDFG